MKELTNELENNNGVEMNERGDVKMERVRLVKELEVAIGEAMVNGREAAIVGHAVKLLNAVKENTMAIDNKNIEIAIKALSNHELGQNIVVKSRHLVDKINKVLKRKEYISILSVALGRDRDTQEDQSIISYSGTPKARVFMDATTEDSITVPAGVNMFAVVKNTSYAPFSKDFITVKFISEGELSTMEDEGIWVVFNGRSTKVFRFNYALNLWKQVGNHREMEVDEEAGLTEEEIKALPGDVRLFKSITFSASGIRNGDVLFKDVTNGDNREDYLDKISNGAWSILKAKVTKDIAAGKYSDEEGQKKLMKNILKQMPRFGQLQAGSLNLGAITSWAYVTVPFVTGDGQTVDGTGYFRASYIAELFSNFLGIKVEAEAVVGMFLQARPDMQKAAYKVLDDYTFDFLLERLKATGKVKFIGSEKDSVKPVLISDDNCVKLESNFDVDCCLELLEIAKASEAHTSKQMLEKAMFVNPTRTAEWLINLAKEDMNAKFVRTFLKADAEIPTPGLIAKGYASDITSAIAPQMKLQSRPIFRSDATNYVKSCANAINKLKFKVDGANARLTSDISEIFAGFMPLHSEGHYVEGAKECRVLKYGEIYMPEAERYMKKNGLEEMKIAMIKYPSMGVKEYYLARVVTKAEVKARIKAMELDNATSKAIYRFFAGTQNGTAILPALDLIMFQCAGLDYDYDGGTFIFDQEYVDILDNGDIQAVKMLGSEEEYKALMDFVNGVTASERA